MLMTDMAVRDLETRRESIFGSLRNLLVSLFGRESDHGLPPGLVPSRERVPRARPQVVRSALSVPTTMADAATEPHRAEGEHRWERHPQLRSRQAVTMPATGDRAARLEAERGIILARGGKLVEAVEAFTVATRDPEVDLATLPGFWDLPRNGMLTAVRAYERTERLRDAAALEARIRYVLRPRVVRPMPDPRPGKLSASGD